MTHSPETTPGFDPRVTPVRNNVAASHLKGVIAATKYVDGQPMQVCSAAAPLHTLPNNTARMDTEILFGESFVVYDQEGDWVWGQSELDSYVGYMAAQHLGPIGTPATHQVSALRTFLHAAPDLKSPVLTHLTMTARIVMTGEQGAFAEIDYDPVGTAFVAQQHLTRLGTYVDDYVTVAEAFMGTPYLWGGKQSLGLDCSGLVQIALARAGIAAPRDADMQEASLGKAIAITPDLKGLQRGDLVFWVGHVGIMVDDSHIVHANAAKMQVSKDILRDFAAKIAPQEGPITSIRRLC